MTSRRASAIAIPVARFATCHRRLERLAAARRRSAPPRRRTVPTVRPVRRGLAPRARARDASRGPVPVPLLLRTHDIVDLLFHQLAQHAERDPDAQRQQPLLRCPNQLAERFLHALRQHGLITGRLSNRYVPFTTVPPSILGGSPRTLPSGADAAGADRRHLKLLRAPDNLAGSVSTEVDAPREMLPALRDHPGRGAPRAGESCEESIALQQVSMDTLKATATSACTSTPAASRRWSALASRRRSQ